MRMRTTVICCLLVQTIAADWLQPAGSQEAFELINAGDSLAAKKTKDIDENVTPPETSPTTPPET